VKSLTADEEQKLEGKRLEKEERLALERLPLHVRQA